MAKSSDNSNRKLALNRPAFRDYFVLERLEAGIELKGTEVKSVKGSHVNLGGSFAKVDEGQAFLYNLNISPYDHGNRFNHQPDRRRRLLLHSREIGRLQEQTDQKGLSLIPRTQEQEDENVWSWYH